MTFAAMLIALMLTLASTGWTQAPPLRTPFTMKVVEVDEPTLIVLKAGAQRICMKHHHDMSRGCWSVPEGITDMIKREATGGSEIKDTCRARLADTVRKLRPYIPNGMPFNLTMEYCDQECWAHRTLERISREKALVAEIDALLQECQ
jgi:hypothetical protein